MDGVDIEVLASGMRHAYDLVLHTNGYVYSTDNGLNSGRAGIHRANTMEGRCTPTRTTS